MAEKKTELSIIIRTVDAATAKIKAINDRLKQLTKPITDFKDALGNLRETSGLDQVKDAFGNVGSAIAGLLAKVAMIGGVVGAATAGLLHLVGEFDDLGDSAERMGVSVDFLAQMRYAAERCGAPVESLNTGLQGFVVNLGKARAGTGRMTAFLKKVSPELLHNLKAAKSNEAAFNVLADAMSHLEDPAKRAALAQATLGDAALAPMLTRGSKGIQELRDRYFSLAGSQEDAAKAAGETDDSLKDLHAATDGVKAALVSGLAPALTEIIKKITEWLRGHRGDVKEWATQLGKKLPAAFSALVDAVQSAFEFLKPFFDTSTKIKIALIALAAVIVGPMISAVVSFGIALMTTPLGWIIMGIAALAVGVYELIKHWDQVKAFFIYLWDVVKGAFLKFFTWIGDIFLTYTPIGQVIKHWRPIADFFVSIWDGVKGAFQSAWDFIKSIVDKIVGAVDKVIGAVKTVKAKIGLGEHVTGSTVSGVLQGAGIPAQAAVPLNGGSSSAAIKVDFANAPKGTRVTADPKSTADVDLSMGYQMGPVM